eukprot:gene6475-23267_t
MLPLSLSGRKATKQRVRGEGPTPRDAAPRAPQTAVPRWGRGGRMPPRRQPKRQKGKGSGSAAGGAAGAAAAGPVAAGIAAARAAA